MIFDTLFNKNKKKDDDSKQSTASDSDANAQSDTQSDQDTMAETRELLGLTPEEVSGVAADVSPGTRTLKRSKSQKVNRALGRLPKRRSRRSVHTFRSFHAPKKRSVKEQVNVYDVLDRPVVTEKSAGLSERGVYAFFVRQSATKHAIADAIEVLYGVRPLKVRIAGRFSKKKRVRIPGRERAYGSTASRKKAYVFLRDGDRIQLT